MTNESHPPSVDEMIDAIEQHCCIRQLWRCNAGWGMMFVREHNEPPEPDFSNDPDRDDVSYCLRRWSAWQERCMELTQQNQVVHKYYDSLEACVRAEYELRVVQGEAP